MKRLKQTICVLLLLSMLCAMAACSDTMPAPDAGEDNTVASEELTTSETPATTELSITPSEPTDTEDPTLPFYARNDTPRVLPENTPTLYLYENTETCAVCAAYPQFPSTEYDAVNALIADFVREQVQRLCYEESGNPEVVSEAPPDFTYQDAMRTLKLSSEVMLHTDDTISIVFWGLDNHRDAAHPTHVFLSLNIDPQTAQPIALADRYVIDDALYEAFAAQAAQDNTTFSEEICGKESFLNGLTAPSDSYFFYFTEEGLGVSYPVFHALGDHWETVIPYAELTAAEGGT